MCVGGNNLWKYGVRLEIFGNRTWQSLRHRYNKMLMGSEKERQFLKELVIENEYSDGHEEKESQMLTGDIILESDQNPLADDAELMVSALCNEVFTTKNAPITRAFAIHGLYVCSGNFCRARTYLKRKDVPEAHLWTEAEDTLLASFFTKRKNRSFHLSHMKEIGEVLKKTPKNVEDRVRFLGLRNIASYSGSG